MSIAIWMRGRALPTQIVILVKYVPPKTVAKNHCAKSKNNSKDQYRDTAHGIEYRFVVQNIDVFKHALLSKPIGSKDT